MHLGNHTSYAGFFRVSPDAAGFESAMFAWYFPPQDGNASAPTVVWLQGGPGGSSLFGLFTEMGPFRVNDAGSLEARPEPGKKKPGVRNPKPDSNPNPEPLGHALHLE